MADSKQLDFLKRFTTHLEGISVAAGYDFDLAGNVFRGRMLFGADDPLPCLAIIESMDSDIAMSFAGENNFLREHTWMLIVQGWAEHGAKHATDALYQLKANVEQHVSRLYLQNQYGDPAFPDDYFLGYWGKGVAGMAPGQGAVYVPRDQVSALAFFTLPIGINWVFDPTDLYVS